MESYNVGFGEPLFFRTAGECGCEEKGRLPQEWKDDIMHLLTQTKN